MNCLNIGLGAGTGCDPEPPEPLASGVEAGLIGEVYEGGAAEGSSASLPDPTATESPSPVL